MSVRSRPLALQNVCSCLHDLNFIVPVEHNAEAHCRCVCLLETVESIFFRAISRTSFLGTHSSIVVSPLLGVWSYSFSKTLRWQGAKSDRSPFGTLLAPRQLAYLERAHAFLSLILRPSNVLHPSPSFTLRLSVSSINYRYILRVHL